MPMSVSGDPDEYMGDKGDTFLWKASSSLLWISTKELSSSVVSLTLRLLIFTPMIRLISCRV